MLLTQCSTIWHTVFIQSRCLIINVPYVIAGTALLITYASISCLKRSKKPTQKDATSITPTKAIIEPSIRLSFHNELPKSEGSDEETFRSTVKTRVKTAHAGVDHTQSGVKSSPQKQLSNALVSRNTPNLCSYGAQLDIRKPSVRNLFEPLFPEENHIGKTSKSPLEANKLCIVKMSGTKLVEDKTQVSLASMDITQTTTESEENDKPNSRTTTESSAPRKSSLVKVQQVSIEPKQIVTSRSTAVSLSNYPTKTIPKRISEMEESGSTEHSEQSPVGIHSSKTDTANNVSRELDQSKA